jgi:hypothetical protein
MVTLNDIRMADLPESLRPLALSAQREVDISFAAAQLARLRHEAKTRPPRVFTGRVFDRRAWRGMRVILPNGQIGSLYRAVRGVAVLQWRDEFALRPDQHVVLSTDELKPFRLAAARVLGGAKRGVKERRSLRKIQAARMNGAAPARGSRPRGRPRAAPLPATPPPGTT